jgi:hypothetical protein
MQDSERSAWRLAYTSREHRHDPHVHDVGITERALNVAATRVEQ